MNLDFFSKYQNIMEKEHYINADKFKNSMIPDHLFKYFPEEDSRIDSILDRQLWLAQYYTFNDKNEFNFMRISKKNLKKAKLLNSKWNFPGYCFDSSIFSASFNEAKYFFESSKRIVSLSCFTTDPDNSYFWEEYANK